MQNKQTNFPILFVCKINKQILQFLNKFYNNPFYYNYNDYNIISMHVVVIVVCYNDYDNVGVFIVVVVYYNYNT